MLLQESLIVFLVIQLQYLTAIDVETTKHCCGLGTNHSLAGRECNSSHTPMEGIAQMNSAACLHFFGVCCLKKQSELECEAGEELGLSRQDCRSATGGKKICCESCVLGKAASTDNPTCYDLGLGSSFVKCCRAAIASSTTESITTTRSMDTSTVVGLTTNTRSSDSVENLCEVEGICAQICIPVGDSYKCDCHKGYSLMDDKVSCKPDKKTRKGISRCDLNNPCEHECLDTGLAVKCLCHDGYELDVDNTSCKDIDECALNLHECIKGEICVNEEGNYYCEDPNYTDSPGDSEKKCPAGYKFNGETGYCDDIDECEFNLFCPSPKMCENTIGSYTCKGEDVKCPPGFYFKAATESCMDVDECITGENNCNRESQICINTKGNYTCAEKVSKKGCPPGFKKNPFTQLCDDVDECSNDIPLCTTNEVCINEIGSYNCVPKTKPTTHSVLTTTTQAPSVFPQRPTSPAIQQTRSKFTQAPTTRRRPHSCPNGYSISSDGKTCLDINECQLGIHTCRETQRCDNTIGSYHCVRMAGCGTGYTYNYAEEICEDDDECELGTHQCGGLGSGYKCRNTQGSYRCELIRRPVINIKTTTRSPVSEYTDLTIISGQKKTCLPGYFMTLKGNCEDIDECQINPCGKGATCFNVPGSYECINKIQCKAGYDLNDAGDGCEDVNECVRGIHKCKPTQICRNGDGYYTCVCPPGHHFKPQTNQCEDIDECKYYKVCYHNSICINTVGSYRCECKEGFRDNGRGCEDIDECAENVNLCEHKCVNIWGSYRCACQSGFTINVDNRTCTDLDECETFKDKKLCIGPCQNIPGSYKCTCPKGYRLGNDKRNCLDIDECEHRVCPNHNDICVNTRGSYKCYTIKCPPNYIRDSQHKSRCKRPPTLCDARDLECLLKPEQYTYHFMAIVSNLPILNGHISLFAIQGPRFPRARTEFNFRIVNVICPNSIPKINENYFRMDVQNYNAMKLYLTRSITGPQEAELEIQMKLYDNNQLTMSAISRLFFIVTEYPF